MLTVGSLFSGIGLLDYGLHLAGLHHTWLCEADPWRRGILVQRWPEADVLDDVRTVGARTAGRVDVIAGGFPCKGASTAGKRNGFDHPETVLWREMARAVGELRPRYVLVENVANILALHDGAVWGEVLGDLASLGYDTVWDCLPAAAVGAPHGRDRVFAIATDAAAERRAALEPAVQQPGMEAVPRAGGALASADADGARGEARRVGERKGCGITGEKRRDHAGPGAQAAPDSEREPVELRGGARDLGASPRGGGGEARQQRAGSTVADCDQDAADAQSIGREGSVEPSGWSAQRSCAGDGRGIAVEWRGYEPAIRRWEAIHGPAPEPLVRRVDDRGAARVERSRLSALGDGVQVQIGHIVGEYIVQRCNE